MLYLITNELKLIKNINVKLNENIRYISKKEHLINKK